MMYNENEKALAYLSQYEFMTSAKFAQILEIFEYPKDIFTESADKLFKLKDVLGDNYEVFLDGVCKYNNSNFFYELEKRNIYFITIMSQNYPDRLLNLKNPPYVLFYCGDISLLKTKCVAIVGTRNPTSYGKVVTEKYAKELAKNGVTIISGLASGVDKISHEGALEVGGKTIAVLGGGFDNIYPAMNINLAREIAKSGLIIIEYYVTIKPTKYTFPTRNRIIAGLSSAVLITEAGDGSGSLYTKEHADEVGIDSYCVPGNITSEKSFATNDLIKKGVAGCTTSPNDILVDLGININKKAKKEAKSSQEQLTIEETAIVSELENGEHGFEYLQIKTGFSTQILNYNLTTLEIRGIIKKLAGNTYILC